jgi:hypothetical protein
MKLANNKIKAIPRALRGRAAPSKGAARKSRRLRISASAFSSVHDYKPSDKEWTTMQEALGSQIPDKVRKGIVDIVQGYFNIAPAENAAPFIDDVQKVISKIRASTICLERALGVAPGDLENTQREARVRVSSAFGGTAKLDALGKMLSGLMRATAAARHKTQADEKLGFREGDAWKRMVTDLRTLFKVNGLPATAAQGRDKWKANRGSDFVEFFAAMQKSFPENLRRHNLGDIFSLAKEINRSSQISEQ